jgi:hypothetical protein
MNKGRTMENHWDNYGQPLGNYGKPWTEGNTMENNGTATKSQMFRQKRLMVKEYWESAVRQFCS